MSSREIVDWTLRESGWGDLASLETARWRDVQPPFETAHYLDGFAHADRRFHFAPDWEQLTPQSFGSGNAPPPLPDYWPVIEEATAEYPFRLVTAPARHFLNSSFTETPTSQRRQRRPTVMIHPDDASTLGVADGDAVRLASSRGAVTVHVEIFDGLQRGVVIVESIWPNAAFREGVGINALTGADPGAPIGGAAFHDNRIAITRVA